MNPTISFKNLLVALAAIAAVFAIMTMVASPSLAQTTIKKVPISPEHAALTDGGELFQAVCASCHGKTGKGDGPAGPALKTMAADLTVLARENGGQFPSGRVQTMLQGKGPTAHGSEEMPMWGPIFKASRSEAQAALRISNLVDYLKSIQVK
jgi:mono/diheme cytochrome c family protein